MLTVTYKNGREKATLDFAPNKNQKKLFAAATNIHALNTKLISVSVACGDYDTTDNNIMNESARFKVYRSNH